MLLGLRRRLGKLVYCQRYRGFESHSLRHTKYKNLIERIKIYMAKNLVIVESPAKARTIGRFLGKDYDVQASMGHVRELDRKSVDGDVVNGVKLTGDEFEPRYTTIRGRGQVIKGLKKSMCLMSNI